MFLNEYLIKSGMTQKELAAKLNIGRSYLCRLLHRNRIPSTKIMQRIIDVTNNEVSFSDLYFDNYEPK